MADNQDSKVSFKDTLNLPHTDFPIRANAQEQDPAMIKRWSDMDLFHTSFTHHSGSEKFVFTRWSALCQWPYSYRSRR